MDQATNWLGRLLLRAPSPLRSLRNAPLVGGIVHFLSYRILPGDAKVWAAVGDGPAQGLWLELNPRTGQTYLRGEAEPIVQRLLAGKLRPGMIFYDLGANIGFFSLMAARIVGETGRVFSFEPDAVVAERLRRNVARNAFSNVTVIEAGLWSQSGTLNFIAAASSSPDRGTGQFVSGDDRGGTATRCISLDDFVREAPAPDAIKIDVEGAEVEVLTGGAEVLQTKRPWILCEVHSEASDRSAREFLGKLGYIVESLDSNHILALPEESAEPA